MADAEEDGAEERDEAAVGAEAEVHRLGVRARVVGEAVVEAEDAQVLGVGRVLDGDEALVFGVEDEDEAQDDAQDALVEVVVRRVERGAQPVDAVAARRVARGGVGEAFDEDLDGFEDLRGEVFGDVGLAEAALAQQAFEGVLGGGAVGAARVEEQLEGRDEGAAGGRAQGVEAEGEVGARFAGGGVDEAEGAAVGDEADGNAGVAEEALELGRRRVAPGAGRRFALVEVEGEGGALGVGGEIPDEGDERGGAVGGGRGVRGLGVVERGEGVVRGRVEGAARDGEARAESLGGLRARRRTGPPVGRRGRRACRGARSRGRSRRRRARRRGPGRARCLRGGLRARP